jgi:hypothetical protein
LRFALACIRASSGRPPLIARPVFGKIVGVAMCIEQSDRGAIPMRANGWREETA